MEPTIVEIKGGWAAVADWWAVFAPTKEEVIRAFAEAKERHAMIASRDLPQQFGFGHKK